MLPYPVNKNNGKAQFDSDKCVLSVTLPSIKKGLLEEATTCRQFSQRILGDRTVRPAAAA